jgi:hypothetical protein
MEEQTALLKINWSFKKFKVIHLLSNRFKLKKTMIVNKVKIFHVMKTMNSRTQNNLNSQMHLRGKHLRDKTMFVITLLLLSRKTNTIIIK